MPLTLTEKILQSHIVPKACSDTFFDIGKPIKTGSHIAIRIDQTLTQDATGTMTYLQFETIGIPRVKTELSVSYIDHNTLQTDFKNMDDHRYLQSIAAKYGLWFSRAGNGICHQVHLEKFGVPGKTLLGSDSHTPTGGALAMIAIGAGGLDVAVAMAGGAFHLSMPKIIGVELTGSLQSGVAAKDIILEVLKRETVKGGLGSVYEYFGKGVQSLSVPQRSTIANMGAELGATCSIFPSDKRTKDFLTAMGRGDSYLPFAADKGAEYCKILSINLDSLKAQAACPHSPDAVQSVSSLAASLAGKPVQQVVIGSCTNSSLGDLAAVAAIVKGKHIAPGLEAGIAPGSRASLLMAEKTGILGELIRAGFRILESACGPCIGQGFAPSSGAISLRTFNRNFKGRSGTADAEVYLVSPETAAASAITGTFTEASSLIAKTMAAAPPPTSKDLLSGKAKGFSLARIQEVSMDNGMLIAPLIPKKACKIEIIRGPNIKPCPSAPAMESSLTLPLILKTHDNVSTDDILPAGAKMLPLRSNIPEISKYTFERIDPDFYANAKALKDAGKSGCIIVGGENYGQGSSREHAALAPMFLGLRAVLARSFARIHRANLINYGILPLIFENPTDYNRLQKGDMLHITNIDAALKNGDTFMIHQKKAENKNGDAGFSFNCINDLDARSRSVLLKGGLAAYTRAGGQ